MESSCTFPPQLLLNPSLLTLNNHNGVILHKSTSRFLPTTWNVYRQAQTLRAYCVCHMHKQMKMEKGQCSNCGRGVWTDYNKLFLAILEQLKFRLGNTKGSIGGILYFNCLTYILTQWLYLTRQNWKVQKETLGSKQPWLCLLFQPFKDCHSSAVRGCMIQLGKLKKTAFMQKREKVNWNQSMFSENATDITDNLEQLKDVVLKQGRNIKFKSLLKENYRKYLNDIIHLRWTRDS